MIYTSYYANWRNFPEGCWKWQVSRTAPIESGIRHAEDFYPSQELLDDYKHGAINEYRYETDYINQLNRLPDDSTFIKELLQKHITGSTDIVLLCYEGKGKFCHRHILAKWLNERYALEITEL